MAASDHLSFGQFGKFDPANYSGWHHSDYGFSTMTRQGRVYPANPLYANALGNIETKDRMNGDDLTEHRATSPFIQHTDVRLFLPYESHSRRRN